MEDAVSLSLGNLAGLQQRFEDSDHNTVLVVEDNKAVRGLLCSYLNSLKGIRVQSAGSMAETQALIERRPQQYFCAVLDLNLPDAPNGEVVDLVRARDIPAVVLTGSVDESVRAAMLKKQVVDYVIKRNVTEIEHVAYIVGRIRENQAIKVLVVDDSRAFRLYLETLLKNYRYQTLSAANGREALTVLAEHPDISLVITDVNMPEMNGLELIAAIRRQWLRRDLAIIGISDASKPGLSALLLKMGANDFLAKPFEVEEFYCRVTQNTNMISYVRQIREAAIRDFLTGVYNRRHLFEAGEVLYANARRRNLQLAAALIDADHFKRINDTFGHQAGDAALKAIATLLRTQLRETDLVGRYGGEEFVCLTVLDEEQHASTAFERLRAAIESIELPQADGQTIRLTVSIGITTDLCDSLESMLKKADEAVYLAKAAGRNRVVRI